MGWNERARARMGGGLRAGRGLSGAGTADAVTVTVYSRDGSKDSWTTPRSSAIREAREETRWENTKRVTVVGPGGEKLFDEEGDYADMGGLSGELDVEAYTHYVLLPSGKIESGWEYKEDAIDRKQELKEDARLRSTVLGRRAVTSRGADPSQDESWHKGPLKRYSNA